MEPNGDFEVEMEMNHGYSFKSLLLDGEGLDDEAGIVGQAPQLGLKRDLDAVEDTLYRDHGLGTVGRERFKSLHLEGEIMEENEIHFSAGDQEVEIQNEDREQIENGKHEPHAPIIGNEEGDSFSKDNYHGFDVVDNQAALFGAGVESFSEDNNHGLDLVDRQAVDCVEIAQVDESTTPPQRKKRRGNFPNPGVVEGKTNTLTPKMVPMKDLCGKVEHVPEEAREFVLQSQELSSRESNEKAPEPEIGLSDNPEEPLARLSPQPSNMQAENLSTLRPSRKRKQLAASSDVQKLLDSVIARQEMFFADLMESMERKEAIRERLREEKEEKWRAEERYQLCAFNNAMIALTQELMGAAKASAQFMNKRN